MSIALSSNYYSGSSSGLCIRITPGACKAQLAVLSFPTFKFMKLRFVFLVGSQILQMLLF